MKLAELYQEAARFAKMIEGTNLTIGDVVKVNGNPTKCKDTPLFNLEAYNYEFALAIVEGRAVFNNDLIYYKGDKYSAEKLLFYAYDHKLFSWNPPKSKTVMVELLREDAEDLAKFQISLARQAAACKKALEE